MSDPVIIPRCPYCGFIHFGGSVCKNCNRKLSTEIFPGVGFLDFSHKYDTPEAKISVYMHDDCTQRELDKGTNDFDKCDAEFRTREDLRVADPHYDFDNGGRLRQKMDKLWKFIAFRGIAVWNKYTKYVRPRRKRKV